MTKILETFPVLTKNDVRSTSSGATGRDVLLSERALSLFRYAVECKSRKQIAVYRDFEQARQHCTSGEVPLLVIKENNEEPLAVIPLNHFMKLVKNENNGNT
ncbi:MAG: hypothetical protein QXL01_04480 [Thermoplasmatales archaeon]